jgi:hypothetical protein
MKPVKNQLPFVSQRSSHLFHRLDLASHGTGTPRVEELASPRGTGVFPLNVDSRFLKTTAARHQFVGTWVCTLH